MCWSAPRSLLGLAGRWQATFAMLHAHTRGVLPAATPVAQAWQPDAVGWLATGGKDGRLFIYDVDNGVPIGKGMPFICQPGAVGAADGGWGGPGPGWFLHGS